MKRLLIAGMLVALLMMVFAPVVGAQVQEEVDEAYLNLKGAGVLKAQGDGIALLKGRAWIKVEGNGILWVKDIGGNASIEVTGYGKKRVFPDGWQQYSGFHGRAIIKGKRVVVVISGVNVRLKAVGRGIARLWGHGTYEVNGISGMWGTKRAMRIYFGKAVRALEVQPR